MLWDGNVIKKASLKKRFLGLTIKQWVWVLVIIPGVPFTVGSLFIVGYSNIPWPIDKIQIKPIRDDVEELMALVHGKGDRPSSWANGFASDLESLVLNNRQQVVTVDWREYSKDMFRCTLNARRIGHDLGEKINEHNNIKRLHLVGHSAGSFVVYGICEAVKKNNKEIFVHTTYLAPVSIYRGIDWGFGTRNFGSCADISDAYIDHEDGVPVNDQPLKHPHTFDVTALKVSAGYTGSPHLWPIDYYRKAVIGGELPYWKPDQPTLKKYPPQKISALR